MGNCGGLCGVSGCRKTVPKLESHPAPKLDSGVAPKAGFGIEVNLTSDPGQPNLGPEST